MRRLLGGLLLLLTSSAWGQSAPPPLAWRLEVLEQRYARLLQEHDRCTADYAELWVQARDMTRRYQEQVQEVHRLHALLPSPLAPEAPDAHPPVSPDDRQPGQSGR